MKQRKIIQIAISDANAFNQSDELESSSRIVALCNDGTLWVQGVYVSGCDFLKKEWRQIDDIPQPLE